MSTSREDFLRIMAEKGFMSWYEAREEADKVLDKHAHELAERQRAEADDLDGWPEEQHVARKYANLIDPEATP